MGYSDLIRNKKSMKYIVIVVLSVSLFLTGFTVLKKLASGKYILPVYITSSMPNELKIRAFNQYQEEIKPLLNDDKMCLFDHYLYYISVDSTNPYAIYTKNVIIGNDMEGVGQTEFKAFLIPLNCAVPNMFYDFILLFIWHSIKFISIALLILYLVIERISYSTDISFRKNKYTFHTAYSFLSFAKIFVISILRQILDIIRNKFLFVALVMLSLTNVPLVIVTYLRLENVDLFLFIVHSIHKLLFDPLFYALIFALLMKIPSFNIFAYAAVSFSIFLNLLDAAVYYFGFTLTEKNHLALVTPYSIFGYFSPQFVILIFILLVALVVVNYFLARGLKRINRNKLAVVVLFFYFVNIPSIVFPVYALFQKYTPGEVYILEKNDDLLYSHSNSLLHFLKEFVFLPLRNNSTSEDAKGFNAAKHYYGLPDGVRSRGFKGPPPRKIVVFACESLSLDLISAHNEGVKPDNSGIWGHPDIYNATKTNLYTTSHNTLQGLITTANSHPNYSLLAEGKHLQFENSYIKKLAKEGYKTIFLRSASKYFAGEDKIFNELGFQEIFGVEDFEDKYPEYVHAWGLMDRMLYRELTKLLETYKNDKVFIMVLGVDTHPLDGRKDFLDLEYPFDNNTFSDIPFSASFLKSVGNMNYDLLNWYESAKKQGLKDDKTCFIFTADHACPLNPAVASIPNYQQLSLTRIPFAIDYTYLDPSLYKDKLASQVDIAPTILDLVGLDYPESYWGDSLFSPDKKVCAVGFDQYRLYLRSRGSRHVINTQHPENYYEKKIVKYFYHLHKKN